jgi:hypothetical protein
VVTGVGHTMGVLGGRGFESVGGQGVRWTNEGNTRYFAHVGHYDSGGWLLPGGIGFNMSRKPEPVFNAKQWSKIDAVLRSRVFQLDQNGMPLRGGGFTHYEMHFHGDLSFPNVKSGDDAKEFLDNLEALVGGV